MTNQKASTVVVPDKQFEALQTIEGSSLLFSIGTAGILYCTREVPGDTHGWVRVDISSMLSSCYNGAVVQAKTFDIAQDLSETNTVDIALVVTVNGIDYLHLATGFTNTLDNWANNVPQFEQLKFDYPGDDINAFQAMPVNDVQILDSNDGSGMQYIIVDLVSNAATQTISRFYIDVSQQHGYAWLPHNLQATIEAGKVTSLLGCGPDDGPNNDYNVGGVYVLGTVGDEAQLFYTPTCNYLYPEAYAESTIFNLPAACNTQYMAMAVSAPAATAPYTDLFFVSNYTDSSGNVRGGLYFLANGDQIDSENSNATPELIYTHNLLQNIQSIHVENWNDNIVLWGQSLSTDGSGTSQLFIMECVAGQETNADAWSCPIPLLFNVENSATYINNNYSSHSSVDPANGNAYGSCNVLFAHQADGTLVQLFQDPVTTAWQQRSLLVVPNTITEVYETTTYSTHIEITDDNNIPQLNVPVYVWSSSPCSVYVTDATNTAGYFTLEFDTPAKFETDFSGNVTIMQAVDAIGGIAFNIAVQDPNTQQWYTKVVNPMAVSIANLNARVPDGNKDYLQGAQVADEYGNQSPLVSSDYNSQTASTSSLVNTICQQNASVSQDGLTSDQVKAGGWPNPATAIQAVKNPGSQIVSPVANAIAPSANANYTAPVNPVKKFARADRGFKHLRFDPKKDKIWGCSFGENAKYHEGIEGVRALGIVLNADGSLSLQSTATDLGGVLSHIEAKIGHVVKWLKSEAHKIEKVIVTVVDDVVDCLITIAGDIYHFVAKCVTDIVNVVHTVLNAIKTAFKDMVAWIGMIFNFKDILTTHAVLKNIINIYIDYAENNFDKLGDYITNLFDALESQIDAKTGLPNVGLPPSTQTYAGAMATSTPPAGSKSPSANFGTHHLKNNGQNSTSNYSSNYSPLETILTDIVAAAKNEEEAFKTLGAQIKIIAENLTTAPFTETISQVLAAIVDLALNSAENFLQLVVEVMEVMLSEIKDVLNATLNIPVISYFYKKMTKTNDNPDGDELSALDLFCLIAAIPVTVIYKAVKQEAPFSSEDPSTIALHNATDMASLQQAVNALPTLSSVQPGTVGHGGSGKNVLNIVGSITAGVGAIVIDFCVLIKSGFERIPTPAEVNANKVLSVIQGVGFMGYVLPDMIDGVKQGGLAAYTKDTWFEGMNNLCTYLSVVKAVIDAASPMLPANFGDPYGAVVGPSMDGYLNVAWQFPTVFELLHQLQEHGKFVPADINAIVSCIGGTFFDLSGLLSPFYAIAFNFVPPSPTQKGVVAGLAISIAGCNLIWGGSCLATTFDGLPVPE